MSKLPKVTPIEHARKMIEAYAGPDWKFERAYWERKLAERLLTQLLTQRRRACPEAPYDDFYAEQLAIRE